MDWTSSSHAICHLSHGHHLAMMIKLTNGQWQVNRILFHWNQVSSPLVVVCSPHNHGCADLLSKIPRISDLPSKWAALISHIKIKFKTPEIPAFALEFGIQAWENGNPFSSLWPFADPTPTYAIVVGLSLLLPTKPQSVGIIPSWPLGTSLGNHHVYLPLTIKASRLSF